MALKRREDDDEAQELIGRWDKQLARLEAASSDPMDGTACYAMIIALLESTRAVLPPEHARLCMLDTLMKWAAVYAHMVSNGEVKREAVPKGLLRDHGKSFERAATYVEKCVQELTHAINVIKNGRKLAGKDKELAARLDVAATIAEASEAKLNDLIAMREMFRNIGQYPDIVAQASMWDGQSKLDPVGMALTRAHSEVEQTAAEAGMRPARSGRRRRRRRQRSRRRKRLWGRSGSA